MLIGLYLDIVGFLAFIGYKFAVGRRQLDNVNLSTMYVLGYQKVVKSCHIKDDVKSALSATQQKTNSLLWSDEINSEQCFAAHTV